MLHSGLFQIHEFFISSIDAVGFSLGATQLLLNPMHIILPLGVSFYTFEAISYIVDIYRGEKPASSWLNYNFYIMYFPHLISGPIVRYKELHAQYESKIELPETSRLKEGFQLLLYGFIFKLIIADSMASISDPLFDKYQTIGHLESWLASIAFTIQIYFDFLGYTHIARGVSLFLILNYLLILIILIMRAISVNSGSVGISLCHYGLEIIYIFL